jgi:hypothetical protein
MINCYHVALIEDGKVLVTGQLSEADGCIETYPGVTELDLRIFTEEDLPPEVEIRTTVAPNGNRINNHVSREAAEVAERWGYRVEKPV